MGIVNIVETPKEANKNMQHSTHTPLHRRVQMYSADRPGASPGHHRIRGRSALPSGKAAPARRLPAALLATPTTCPSCCTSRATRKPHAESSQGMTRVADHLAQQLRRFLGMCMLVECAGSIVKTRSSFHQHSLKECPSYLRSVCVYSENGCSPVSHVPPPATLRERRTL